MSKPEIQSVRIYLGSDQPEEFSIHTNATAIYWSQIEGPHCYIKTVCIEICGKLKHEVPFHQTASVTYA